MKNIFKGFVNKVLGKERTKEDIDEITTKGPIMPGLEETSEDVGKKVFEKTGRIREGVGQSSTLGSQEREEKIKKAEVEDKTNQGVKPEKKTRGRKQKEKK